MKVLILAAGYGTRLYPLIKDLPKALLNVQNKPIINYILNTIKSMEGLDEVLVVTNNKFEKVFWEWAKERKSDFPHKITIINDGTDTPEQRLGSIGDIRFALKAANVQDDVLVVGSDNLFNFNIKEFLAFCKQKSPEVTIGLYDINSLEEAKKFGVVGLDQNQKINSFEEKPAQPKSTLIAMCFYYLPKKSLGLIEQYLVESKKSDTAGDYIRWLHEKNNVFGFKFSGKWYDIGSIEAYKDAEEHFGEK